ncbi:MAG: glycosyltransferase family 9 protein [Planctomycetota bacterium]
MNIYHELLKLPRQRILILRTSSFGDIVKTIPVCVYLKKVLSNPYLDWVIKEKYVRLIEIFGFKNFITQEAFIKQARNSILSFFKLLFSSYSPFSDYDIIFDFQGNAKSGFISLFFRAKYKAGFTARYCKELNFLFRNRFFNTIFHNTDSAIVKSIGMGKLIINTYEKPFELLYKLGFPQYPFEFLVPQLPEEKVASVLGWLRHRKIGKFVLIHPGTSKKGENKRWEVTNFVRLICEIKKHKGLPSIILLGKDEKALYPFFKNLSLIPDFEVGLEEMIILMKNCYFFIGNDSAPLHLASILGTKSIGIYRASNPLIMGFPGGYFASNYFFITEKQQRNFYVPVSFEQVWRVVEKICEAR